jgi:acyl carrier protein
MRGSLDGDPMTDPRDAIRAFILGQFLSGTDASALKDDQSLERSGVIDSAGMLELIMFLEEKFGFAVEAEEALPSNFDTVNALVAYAGRKLAA